MCLRNIIDMQLPIKKQPIVDIHLIKDKIVIFSGINFKIYQVIWNVLLRLHLKVGSHLRQWH